MNTPKRQISRKKLYQEDKPIFVGSFNVDLMELIREENEEMRRRNAILRERIKIAKQR